LVPLGPILIALGLDAGAGVGVELLRGVVVRFWAWAVDDGNLDRLFRDLDDLYGHNPAFSSTALAPVREDPQFVLQLAVAFATGSFNTQEVATIIVPYVGATENQTEQELALDIAVQLKRLLPRAVKDDTEGLHLHMDLLEANMADQVKALHDSLTDASAQALRVGPTIQVVPTAATVRSEGVGVPKLVRDRLDELRSRQPHEANAIERSIFGGGDPRIGLRSAVDHPPTWLAESSQAAWTVVAEIADRYLLRDVEETAFVAAAERPGPWRASSLARASMAARARGSIDRADELLASAREIDPHDADVEYAEIFQEPDESAKLARFDAMAEPRDTRQRWFRQAGRALALLMTKRYQEARAALDEADEIRPDALLARIYRVLIDLNENFDAHGREETVDRARLLSAIDRLLSLRDDFRELGRLEESGLFLAYAAKAAAVAGERERAKELLTTVLDEGERHAVVAEGHSELAAAAALVDDALVRELIPEPGETDSSRLAWAQAVSVTGDEINVVQALGLLDALVTAPDEAIRQQAAFTRLALALEHPTIDWSEEAAAALRELDAAAEAMLLAERHARLGENEPAKRLLLPHLDDLGVLRVYVSILAREEAWEAVVNVLRPVVERSTSSPSQKLLFADAARRSGARGDASRVLNELRSNLTISQSDRDHAFYLACRIAERAGDFGELEQLTAAWLEQHPDSEEAAWRRIFALFQLARPEEALLLIDAQSLEPQDEGEARLIALIVERAAPIGEAVMRMRDLSDRFGRPETLEALLLITALRSEQEQDEKLAEELSQRLQEFVERFPDSQAIRSVQIEPTDEGIDRLFRDYIEPVAVRGAEQHEQLINGQIPVPVVAASTGTPLSFLWWELQGMLPLAFPDRALLDLEREDAADAISAAVARDPSSFVIPRLCSGAVQQAIANAFPGSRIVHATLADLDNAADHAESISRDHMLVGTDPISGQRWRAEIPAAVAASRAAELRSAAESAQRIGNPDPDIDSDRPTDLDELIRENEAGPAFASWPASFALAQRRGLPLFSDDRVIRVIARRANLPSFGTLALLDALTAKGLLDARERIDARRALRALGAFGLSNDIDELVAEAREAQWHLTASLRGALLDRTAWRTLPGESLRFWVPFLSAAREAPDLFPGWTSRVIDAGVLSFPVAVDHAFLARSLLLVSLMAESADGLFGDLIEPLRTTLKLSGEREDPLAGALRMLEEFLNQPNYRPLAPAIRSLMIHQLSFRDQIAVLVGARIREPWER
jgi:predicted nucleic acid-binding protein